MDTPSAVGCGQLAPVRDLGVHGSGKAVRNEQRVKELRSSRVGLGIMVRFGGDCGSSVSRYATLGESEGWMERKVRLLV